MAVRDGAGVEDTPAVSEVRVGKLPDQARLAHAGFPHYRNHLPIAAASATQHAAELLQLASAPHEVGQPAGSGDVEPRANGAHADNLEDFDCVG